MIPRGGIDSQIDQRKAQFGANPQALQQRYGQSKDLLDLLALQQIAKEQEQKSQMMALQMQQNPATIATQLEQEVLQGKKAGMAQSLQGMQAMRAPKRSQSETARGVAGALAQRQRQQQSNMQKVARSGIAAQPAKNLERMYDGGIVGFKAGGITDEEVQAERLRLKGRDKRLTDAQIRSRLETRRKIESLGKFDAEAWEARDEEIKARRRAAARRKAIEAGVLEDKDEGESPRVQEAEALGVMPVRRRAPDPMGGGTVSDLLTAESLEDDSYVQPTPEKVEQTAPRESVDEAIAAAVGGIDTSDLGNIPPQISAGTSPTFDTGSGEFQSFLEEAAGGYARPDREPPPQEDRLSGIFGQLKSSMAQEAEDIKRAREAHDAKYGGRSKGKKFLDRFIRAAQLQNQGRMRTSNRDALAGFLGGFATATGEERDAAQEGLEAIAERQRQLTQGQLGIATGIAGIEQGERGLDLQAEVIGVSRERLKQAAEIAANELGFKYSKLNADKEEAARMGSINEESNKIQREFNNARTEQAKQNLLATYEQLIFDYDDAIDEALTDEIEAIRTYASEADKQTEIEAARKRAVEVKRKRRGMLRAMQEQATGITVPSETNSAPDTNENVVGIARELVGT